MKIKSLPVTKTGDAALAAPDLNRRGALQRIALGATMTVSAPWVVSRAAASEPGEPCGAVPAGEIPEPCAPMLVPPQSKKVNPRLSCGGPASSGQKALSIVGSILGGLIGLIPKAGGPLSLLFKVIWGVATPGDPVSCTPDDVWKAIQDRVQAMIDASIRAALQTFYADLTRLHLGGLKSEFTVYLNAVMALSTSQTDKDREKTLDTIRNRGDGLLTACVKALVFCTGTSQVPAWVVLPTYVQVGNLYLTLIADLVAHAADYGIGAAQLAEYKVRWSMALGRTTVPPATMAFPPLTANAPQPDFYCIRYAYSTVGNMWQMYAAQYQAARRDFGNGANREVNSKQWFYKDLHSGLSARGAWDGLRRYNENIFQSYLLTVDFLTIWGGLPNDPSQPSTATPVKLLRRPEVGPFGWPDVRDIGLEPNWHKVRSSVTPPAAIFPESETVYYVDTPVSIVPGVDSPAVSIWQGDDDRYQRPGGGGPLRLIHLDGNLSYNPYGIYNSNFSSPKQYWQYWVMPTTHRMYGDDRPLNPPPGFNMSVQADNPVVAVNVFSYDCWVAHSFTYSYDRTASSDAYIANTRFIGALEFVCADKTSQTVGSKANQMFPPYQDHHPESFFRGEMSMNMQTATVDDDHVLIDMYQPSGCFHLFKHFDNSDRRCMGSVMFRFARKDPEVKATPATLAALYVASPEALTIEDLVRIGRASQLRHGRDMTQEEIFALADELVDRIAYEQLDAAREAHWQAMTESARQAQ